MTKNRDIRHELEHRILLLDGGFGTMIQQYGLDEADYRGKEFAASEKLLRGCNDLLNLTRPETIREIHEKYLQAYRTLTEFDPEEFAREFNTNVRSSFALVKAFLPGMAKRGFGRIITIGSVNQWKQSPRLCIYASTKSAQVNMIMNCARSYAKFGITANNIAPGVIATDRNKAALDDPAMAEMIMKQIPAARFGTAEDCAGLALLLCSDAGSYITGADIPVAGGMQL